MKSLSFFACGSVRRQDIFPKAELVLSNGNGLCSAQGFSWQPATFIMLLWTNFTFTYFFLRPIPRFVLCLWSWCHPRTGFTFRAILVHSGTRRFHSWMYGMTQIVESFKGMTIGLLSILTVNHFCLFQPALAIPAGWHNASPQSRHIGVLSEFGSSVHLLIQSMMLSGAEHAHCNGLICSSPHPFHYIFDYFCAFVLFFFQQRSLTRKITTFKREILDFTKQHISWAADPVLSTVSYETPAQNCKSITLKIHHHSSTVHRNAHLLQILLLTQHKQQGLCLFPFAASHQCDEFIYSYQLFMMPQQYPVTTYIAAHSFKLGAEWLMSQW